jgi:ATP-dependent RNA helicase RhlE
VRQNLFFSATMPKEIGQLAAELLRNPVMVQATPVAKPVDRVAQKVIFIETQKKRSLLVELFGDAAMSRALIFTRTKRGADRVARHLEGAGIRVAAIHGNKSQGQRERALGDFKASRIRALVATDIAARGIDVDLVTHVVNFELPNVPENYVHRIGRTARAGAAGIAISLCDSEERTYLQDIERLTRQAIPSEDRRGEALLIAVGREADRAAKPRNGKRHNQSKQGRAGRPQAPHANGHGNRRAAAGRSHSQRRHRESGGQAHKNGAPRKAEAQGLEGVRFLSDPPRRARYAGHTGDRQRGIGVARRDDR